MIFDLISITFLLVALVVLVVVLVHIIIIYLLLSTFPNQGIFRIYINCQMMPLQIKRLILFLKKKKEYWSKT